MRRTSAPLLFGLAVLGGAAGWLLQVALASTGTAVLIPPIGTSTVLLVIAIAVLLVALPVRRSVRAKGDAARRRLVDPFYAMRALMLAKASSILGAFTLGMGLSLVGYAFSRTGDVETPAFWPSVLLAVGALAMLVAGLIAESWCRIPPEDPARPDRAGASVP